jgi:hypothetical protein
MGDHLAPLEGECSQRYGVRKPIVIYVAIEMIRSLLRPRRRWGDEMLSISLTSFGGSRDDFSAFDRLTIERSPCFRKSRADFSRSLLDSFALRSS